MDLNCSFGPVSVSGYEETPWKIMCCTKKDGEVEEIHFSLDAAEPAVLPKLCIGWHMPLNDISMRWTAFHSTNQWLLQPVWASEATSSLAYGMPLVSFLNPQGRNRITVAFSDAVRPVKFQAGIYEETPDIEFNFKLFTAPEAPCRSFSGIIRIDTLDVFYADAVADASEWFASFPAYKPADVPAAALEPVYSTWYSYHQELFAEKVESECRAAVKYGMKTVIVDDGWHTDDNQKKYTYCGDWELSEKRFPDMKQHVKNIHDMGMKYILWYSVSYLGSKSKATSKFADKTLIFAESVDAYVLDPRFPEVREHLISIYENAVKEWDIDGFKLDFIDAFQFFCEDPAIKDNYAGRDILSLPDAVDRLLSDAMTRLKKLKHDILVEFRQSYMGPAIRKYGNMIRVSDCPCDYLSNRIGMAKLRMTSGNTCVHSDMITWDYSSTPENAALQLLNVFFCVPQISVKLNELPQSHAKMLTNWLSFWLAHRDVLLKGKLTILYPESNYGVIAAENESEKVIAVYDRGRVVSIGGNVAPVCWIINATPDDVLFVDIGNGFVSAEIYDVFCEKKAFGKICFDHSPVKFSVPPSGLLKIVMEA